MRVLAFEDHYDIEAILDAGGVQTDDLVIEQRWNSSDALDWIRRFVPDVLLLDHFMPPKTGYEVLNALLRADIPRPSRIVAMSSASEKNHAMVALGADEGVVKFDLASLPFWPKTTGEI